MPALKDDGLSTHAYARVREAIVSGKFAAGEPLFEVHLAAWLDMSRTPVREAMRILARDGFLQVIPGRGYIVPQRSLDDIRELFELRESLEGMASRYAALRATDAEIDALQALCRRYEEDRNWRDWAAVGTEFHNLLVDAARNTRLKNMLESLKAQIVQSRVSSLRDNPVRHAAVIAEHGAILNCVKARDGEAAEALTRAHVRLSYQAALEASRIDPAAVAAAASEAAEPFRRFTLVPPVPAKTRRGAAAAPADAQARGRAPARKPAVTAAGASTESKPRTGRSGKPEGPDPAGRSPKPGRVGRTRLPPTEE